MSILSGLMDGLAPYLNGAVQAGTALQAGRMSGEELRRKDQLAEEERRAKRRDQVLMEAIRNIDLKRGQQSVEKGEIELDRARKPEPNVLEYRGLKFSTPQEYFDFVRRERSITHPQGGGWSPSTDPAVLRETYFRDNKLGPYRPDGAAGAEGALPQQRRRALSDKLADDLVAQFQGDANAAWQHATRLDQPQTRRMAQSGEITPAQFAAARTRYLNGQKNDSRMNEAPPATSGPLAPPAETKAAGAPGRDVAAPRDPKKDTAAAPRPLPRPGGLSAAFAKGLVHTAHPSTAPKRAITSDQAAYLREVQGWSDERIQSTYEVGS